MQDANVDKIVHYLRRVTRIVSCSCKAGNWISGVVIVVVLSYPKQNIIITQNFGEWWYVLSAICVVCTIVANKQQTSANEQNSFLLQSLPSANFT
jgi:uncharacterized membrane protein YbjE (DUF340 family)